jgi:hypothetical protein
MTLNVLSFNVVEMAGLLQRGSEVLQKAFSAS